MDRIFELYDEIVEEHVSYHGTLKGALTAMAESITKINPALCNDYDQNPSLPNYSPAAKIDFSLRYRIKTHFVKE